MSVKADLDVEAGLEDAHVGGHLIRQHAAGAVDDRDRRRAAFGNRSGAVQDFERLRGVRFHEVVADFVSQTNRQVDELPRRLALRHIRADADEVAAEIAKRAQVVGRADAGNKERADFCLELRARSDPRHLLVRAARRHQRSRRAEPQAVSDLDVFEPRGAQLANDGFDLLR